MPDDPESHPFRREEDGYLRMPQVQCPVCGYLMDATMAASGRPVVPKDGDYSLCIDCVEPSRFVVTAFGVALRACTIEERDAIMIEQRSLIESYRIARRLLPPRGEN